MALIKNCHEDTGMEPTGSHFPKLPISKLGWQSLLFLCISIKTTLRPTITKCKCFQSQYKSVINLGVFLQTPGKQRWHLFFFTSLVDRQGVHFSAERKNMNIPSHSGILRISRCQCCRQALPSQRCIVHLVLSSFVSLGCQTCRILSNFWPQPWTDFFQEIFWRAPWDNSHEIPIGIIGCP